MSLDAELEEIKIELVGLNTTLDMIRQSALLDHIVEKHEQDSIDEMKALIKKAEKRRDSLAAKKMIQAAEEQGKKDQARYTSNSNANDEDDEWPIKSKLSGSVGKGGNNYNGDAATVQQLINLYNHGERKPKGKGLVVDGDAGGATAKGIAKFQSDASCAGKSDKGVVEPDSPTWIALKGGKTTSSRAASATDDDEEVIIIEDDDDERQAEIARLQKEIGAQSGVLTALMAGMPAARAEAATDQMKLANSLLNAGELAGAEAALEQIRKLVETEDLSSKTGQPGLIDDLMSRRFDEKLVDNMTASAIATAISALERRQGSGLDDQAEAIVRHNLDLLRSIHTEKLAAEKEDARAPFVEKAEALLQKASRFKPQNVLDDEIEKLIVDLRIAASWINLSEDLRARLTKAYTALDEELAKRDQEDADISDDDLADRDAYAAYLRKIAPKLKRKIYNVALGVQSGGSGGMRFRFDLRTPGKSLVGQLKKVAKFQILAYGQAGGEALAIDAGLDDESPRILLLKLEKRVSVPGLNKRVKEMFSTAGVTAFKGARVIKESENLAELTPKPGYAHVEKQIAQEREKTTEHSLDERLRQLSKQIDAVEKFVEPDVVEELRALAKTAHDQINSGALKNAADTLDSLDAKIAKAFKPRTAEDFIAHHSSLADIALRQAEEAMSHATAPHEYDMTKLTKEELDILGTTRPNTGLAMSQWDLDFMNLRNAEAQLLLAEAEFHRSMAESYDTDKFRKALFEDLVKELGAAFYETTPVSDVQEALEQTKKIQDKINAGEEVTEEDMKAFAKPLIMLGIDAAGGKLAAKAWDLAKAKKALKAVKSGIKGGRLTGAEQAALRGYPDPPRPSKNPSSKPDYVWVAGKDGKPHLRATHDDVPQCRFEDPPGRFVYKVNRGWTDETEIDWNWYANNPQPNARYEYENGYSYVTDSKGRTTEVTARLKDDPWDRDPNTQRKAGKTGEAGNPDESYDGGHLIPRELGGPPGKLNLVPMQSYLNQRGRWRKIEEKWRDLVKEGRNVKVQIDVIYYQSGNKARRNTPKEWRVKTFVDGVLLEPPDIVKNRASG